MSYLPVLTGTSAPESSITAVVGRTYLNTTNNMLYVKSSGTGNTGWKLTDGSATITAYSGAGPHTAAATNRLITVSHTSAVTLNLPSTASSLSCVTIKNIGLGILTIDASSTQTIDGSLTYILNADESVTLIVSSGNWLVF